ncbi:acetylserotonin O-methyltransferase [Amycolatopsis sp. EV170708-02-1]|uniref:acetylserotonin O-methyltransferase n=1 Tax=Amycolatopsis sp. EV170708-02-1 TaxID=2919322 RepID=UPI001F0CC8F1|nr:acetylserotonin O-methyltransferase [Amycolatopsis sp. EV170708-02-1]UMP03726.1 acetylserotonin O-methyltransferase [Amycolatopsis sp. EV170708-02-1]
MTAIDPEVRTGNGTDETAARAVVDIVTGTWRAQALHAAVALGLPDHLAEGHVTSASLAARAQADPDGVLRLMRLLVAIGVFGGDDRTGYRLTPISQLLRTGTATSMREMCRLYGEEFHQAWGSVVTAVRTGRSGFEHAFDRTLHEYLAEVPGAGQRFLDAMNAGSTFFADVPAAFDFTRGKTIADLGGGSGNLMSTVLQAHPHLRGVLVDKEHMLPVARNQLVARGCADRCEVVAGDIFEGVPKDVDFYLLSRILQDWDDSECITLLTHCRRAMADDSARVLILERVIPDSGTEVLPLLWDLHLLMMAGGRERTLASYESILDGAGLRLESAHPLALETTLLVAAPTRPDRSR